MNDNKYRHTGTAALRDDTKNILDGTRFLGHHYVVFRHGEPLAQIIPPSDERDIDTITVTDIRLRAREILKAIHDEGKTFLILRYGRVDAVICPLQHTLQDDNHLEKEKPLAVAAARDTGTGRDKLPTAATGTV